MNKDPHIQSPRNGRTRRAARTLVVILTLLGTLPLIAQEARVYRDGRSWVEETNGTLPSSRTLRVSADVGTIKIQGGAQALKFVIKKRSWMNTEADAREQFDRYKIRSSKAGDAAVLEVRRVSSKSNRFGVDVFIDIPREMDNVRVETMAGNITVTGTTAN